MKITDVTTWVVNVPWSRPFRSSFETKTGTTRTVLRLRTDTGLEGWGETMHGRPVAALIDKLAADVLGCSPFDLEALHRKLDMIPFFYGYLGYCAIAGLDVAYWDLIGKATGQPLTNLIGGRVRDRIPLTAVVTRGDVADAAERDVPAALAEHAEALVADEFTAVKVKGSRDMESDVRIMAALADRLPGTPLRIDPNAVWTVHESIQAGMRMEGFDLEYLEDPCAGLEGMRAVKQRVRIPLSTNMCVVRFEDFAPAVRLEAVDVILGDVFKWGGVSATKHLASHCETFGIGMNMHSGGELGLSTAVHLAVAASTPALRYAIDSGYPRLTDDIITAPLAVESGTLRPPDEPGIGVDIDVDKLTHYARLNETEGDYTL